MSIKNRITDFFAPEVDEEEEYLEVNEEEAKSISKYEKPKARGVSAAETNIVMFEPRSFDEVVEIAKHLKERRAAVVNLRKLSYEYKQRTIDFLQGVTFGLSGATKHIDRDAILCTPVNIGVDGSISQDEE